MHEDDRPAALRDFMAELIDVWCAAGRPSYRELERWSTTLPKPHCGLLTRSTVQGHLTGARKTLLREELLIAFVKVLRIIVAREGRTPEEVIGTVEYWTAKRRSVLAELMRSPGTIPDLEQEATNEEGPHQATSHDMALMAVDQTATTLSRFYGEQDIDSEHAPLLALARRFGTLDWWKGYGDLVEPWFAPYLGLERAAERIETYECQFIPGLLQTPAYAEDVIRLRHANFSNREVQRRVELRMLRQEILGRPVPPRLWFVVDEAVLRRRYGNRRTMRAQLQHLLDVSYDHNVTIHVMPLAKGGYIAAGGPITVLRFTEKGVRDVVYLERLDSATYPLDPGVIATFGALFGRLSIWAAKSAAARPILARILNEI
jgi:Domain of unknown function (DUF5753)